MYAVNFTLSDPVSITFFECPIGGGLCAGATLTYSVNVVAPEPATVSLLSLGLAAFAIRRFARRSAHNEATRG